ncbi:hypothetical protein [Bacteroides sp.]|uniref:hypothetical protein n=1 Tax=Bacteroides sp. TaxID=29523 RepID=UPI0026106D19|nr:hypothetical protein [Bacteroides sp.]MDD3041070.1 hypothetical protein [Bacteroides sp.]
MYDDSIYLPLPHTIIQAATSSLLYRITEGNNSVRERFGKHTLEDYNYMLFQKSGVYDEVKSEYRYVHSGQEKRTMDVMVRRGEYCLLIESKSMVPSTRVRVYDETAIEDFCSKTVAAIVQVYRHITCQFMIEYFPFDEAIQFAQDSIFGIVVLLEDHYIRRDILFRQAAQKLAIDYESDEYKYLCSHVKVLSLFEVERMTLRSVDIIEACSSVIDDPIHWFDYTLPNDEEYSSRSTIIDCFVENETNELLSLAEELVSMGLLQEGG